MIEFVIAGMITCHDVQHLINNLRTTELPKEQQIELAEVIAEHSPRGCDVSALTQDYPRGY